MNDPLLVITKLESLARSAMSAESEYEKAAIFGATRSLIADLDAGTEEELPHLGENIERVRWGICAILGYDIANGHDKDQHLSWALAALNVLRRSFGPAQ